MIFRFLLGLVVVIAAVAADSNDKSKLVGTWTSKSNTVFTGPGFYDPVDELLIEPDLPGISYSFTEDGYYEEALYRVTSNPQNHSCASAVLIFQHGKYTVHANGSVTLNPFEVDGRQLLSQPCKKSHSEYSRYKQKTFFKSFEVSVNTYNGRNMLQIYQFDGSKMQPLYLAYKPPLMLPTITLNPTGKSSQTGSTRKRVRRSLENQYRTNAVREVPKLFELFWWFSIAAIGASSAYLFLH